LPGPYFPTYYAAHFDHFVSPFAAALTRAFNPQVGLSLLFFAVGVWFYASKFPEARWPGKFDVWVCA
jgi:predicted membrane channel-forming protein YqfA (hemolysin III family)